MKPIKNPAFKTVAKEIRYILENEHPSEIIRNDEIIHMIVKERDHKFYNDGAMLGFLMGGVLGTILGAIF